MDSALHFLTGEKLDGVKAAVRKIDGPDGFFLSTLVDDASFFAARRNGTVIEFQFSESARGQLDAAGLVCQLIPRGLKSPRFAGDELIVDPDQFDLFNQLLDNGDITVVPANF